MNTMSDIHPLLEGIDPDRAGAIYNKGVMEGMKHSQPSPETRKEIAEIKHRLATSEAFHEEQRKFMEEQRVANAEQRIANAEQRELAIKVNPIIEALDGASTVGKMTQHFAAFVISAGAIAGAFVYLVKWSIR